MKKWILMIFLMFFCVFSLFGVQTNVVYAQNSTNNIYIVTANHTYLYADFDFSAEKLLKVSNKTEVVVEVDDNKPVEYKKQENGYVFYKVFGYSEDRFVCADFVTLKTNAVTTLPNFNAKTSAVCYVFFEIEPTPIESNIKLSKGTPIFLYKGYDKNADFIAVCFEYENEVQYGYIKRECISPNGINPLIITCITIILALLGIIFAWLFIKKKKVKKMA